MAAIQTNIKELVRLLGHPDDAVSEEAGNALLQVGEPAVELLAAAIQRPSSPVHRIKAIFAIRFIRPRNSLAAQLALIKVEKSEKDARIARLASTVLFALTMDEVEHKAIESRWQRCISEGATDTTTGSFGDRQSKPVKERLSELRAKE
jgi:HEAT repeat protein